MKDLIVHGNVSLKTGDYEVAALLRQELEPLWLANEVDMGIWGHHHLYQRFGASANNTLVQGSTNRSITAEELYPLETSASMVPSENESFLWATFEKPSAPVHILMGMAGPLDKGGDAPVGSDADPRDPSPPSWEKTIQQNGYTIFEAINATHATLLFVADVPGKDGGVGAEVQDRVLFIKE